jgi:hypothetical protein
VASTAKPDFLFDEMADPAQRKEEKQQNAEHDPSCHGDLFSDVRLSSFLAKRTAYYAHFSVVMAVVEVIVVLVIVVPRRFLPFLLSPRLFVFLWNCRDGGERGRQRKWWRNGGRQWDWRRLDFFDNFPERRLVRPRLRLWRRCRNEYPLIALGARDFATDQIVMAFKELRASRAGESHCWRSLVFWRSMHTPRLAAS